MYWSRRGTSFLTRALGVIFRGAGLEVLASRYGGALDDSEIGEDELIGLLAEADAIVTGNAPIGRKTIESSPRLKVISYRGVGYDSIDVAAATERGVKVTITPGAADATVADYAFGLMLAIARGIPLADRTLRGGKWDAFVGTEVYGKTLGLVGMGRIGKAVARRAAGGFDMRVLAFDQFRDAAFAAQLDIRYVDLEELLRSSDFVSIHMPLSGATRGLIGRRELQLMKPGAFLINTARGAIIDEAAVYDALKSRSIAGAALDVFAVEPMRASSLRELDNVITTPHMAGYSREGKQRSNSWAAQNAVDVLAGRVPSKGVALN